jgi:hypothetical protein
VVRTVCTRSLSSTTAFKQGLFNSEVFRMFQAGLRTSRVSPGIVSLNREMQTNKEENSNE